VRVNTKTWRARIYWGAVALVFLLFFLGCFHGVANYWQWGHNGFNGAAFSQAARNSLRFDLLPQTPYYAGLTPPEPNHWYTDHPMMLHLHLMAFQEIFGYSECVNRMIPALYSFLSLLVLFFLVLRLAGKAAALISACIYTLTPLNLIFANMINHEQGAIFWCLCFLYGYCRWHQTGMRRHTVLALVSITFAAQFDWPAYYLAFVVALHALATGIRRHPGWLRWRREYTWTAVFSAVVLLNFFGFFLWIQLMRGGLGHMWGVFNWRSESQGGYLPVLFERALDLRGVIPIGLLGAWGLYTIERAIRRKLGLIDLVPALFFITQLIHSAVFQQAGRIHSYWTYYLGPAFAIGGAIALGEAWKGLKPVLRPVAMATAAVLLIFQAQFAYRHLRWGFSTGHGAYVQDYHDQHADIMWAQELNRIFGRDSVHYRIHFSVQRWRLEATHTLDAPHNHQPGLHLPSSSQRIRHPVLLVDLNRLSNRQNALAALNRLKEKHRTFVWDRRFVAIDGGTPATGTTAFISRTKPASFWWRWLCNPDRPPIEWVPDPDPRVVAALFEKQPAPYVSGQRGGRGGGGFLWTCTQGQVIDRLSGQTQKTRTHPMVSAIQPTCRDRRAQPVLAPLAGPWLGRVRSAPGQTIACRKGDRPVGIYGNAGALVDGIGLLCARGNDVVRSNLIGTPGGSSFEQRCPTNSVLTGLTGRATKHIHAIGIVCVDLGAKEK
jgi:4-amino-4-deoxy-L-arabinose transferase-like glycosyltransferase